VPDSLHSALGGVDNNENHAPSLSDLAASLSVLCDPAVESETTVMPGTCRPSTGALIRQEVCVQAHVLRAYAAFTAVTVFAAGSGAGGADGGESGPGDLELAVACWWRAAALQALSAYVMGIMGKGMAEDAAQQASGSNYMCKAFFANCLHSLGVGFN
jgi:hypothetical protein